MSFSHYVGVDSILSGADPLSLERGRFGVDTNTATMGIYGALSNMYIDDDDDDDICRAIC